MIFHQVFILKSCIRVLRPGPHPLFKITMFSLEIWCYRKWTKNRTFKTLASDESIVILPIYVGRASVTLTCWWLVNCSLRYTNMIRTFSKSISNQIISLCKLCALIIYFLSSFFASVRSRMVWYLFGHRQPNGTISDKVIKGGWTIYKACVWLCNTQSIPACW